MGGAASTDGAKYASVDHRVNHFMEQRVLAVSSSSSSICMAGSTSTSNLGPETDDNRGCSSELIRKYSTEDIPILERTSSKSAGQQMMPSAIRLRHQSSKNLLIDAHKSSMSLRAMAIRHYSRQDNTYIPQEDLSASLLETRSGHGSAHGSWSKKISPGNSVSNMSKVSEGSGGNPLGLTLNLAGIGGSGGSDGRKRPNLKIQIHDDPDWVQVSDDDDIADMHLATTPRAARQSLNLANHAAAQSYLFTQSGMIFVDGFTGGIGPMGITTTSSKNASGQHVDSSGTATPANGSRLNLVDQTRLSMRERLVVLCKLGTGASSIVYKALDLNDMQVVALKMIPVYDRAKRRQMVRELSALFMILRQRQTELNTSTEVSISDAGVATGAVIPFVDGFDNLVRFFDAFSNLEDGGCALCMEYMDGGSLQDIVDAGGCDDEDSLASIAYQSLKGLDFLHSCDYIHRDVKPGNILIDHKGVVKISDLGILRKLDPHPLDGKNSTTVLDELLDADDSHTTSPVPGAGGEGEGEGIAGATGAAAGVEVEVGVEAGTGPDEQHVPKRGVPRKHRPSIQRVHTFVGTAVYMAPERIDGRDYTFSSDIWSLGLTLLTVALGKIPIDQQGGYWSILHSVRDSAPPVVPDDGRFSDDFKDFIALCLKTRPEDRKSCAELLEHPFAIRGMSATAAGSARTSFNLPTPAPASAPPTGALALSIDTSSAMGIASINHDHYVAELQVIMYGLFSHLQKLVQDANLLITAPLLVSEPAEKEKPDSLIMAVLKKRGVVATMRLLLLGEGSVQERDMETEEFEELRLSRVGKLAMQLNLNPDMVFDVATKFCDDLASGVIGATATPAAHRDLEVETPKARHG